MMNVFPFQIHLLFQTFVADDQKNVAFFKAVFFHFRNTFLFVVKTHHCRVDIVLDKLADGFQTVLGTVKGKGFKIAFFGYWINFHFHLGDNPVYTLAAQKQLVQLWPG